MSTGTTPNTGLPYPNDDDPLRQGAQRIRELAQAIDTGTPVRSKWVRAFFASDAAGASAWNSGVTPKAYFVYPETDYALTTVGRIISGATVSWWLRALDTGAVTANSGVVTQVLVLY